MSADGEMVPSRLGGAEGDGVGEYPITLDGAAGDVVGECPITLDGAAGDAVGEGVAPKRLAGSSCGERCGRCCPSEKSSVGVVGIGDRIVLDLGVWSFTAGWPGLRGKTGVEDGSDDDDDCFPKEPADGVLTNVPLAC